MPKFRRYFFQEPHELEDIQLRASATVIRCTIRMFILDGPLHPLSPIDSEV
jgi:hypothetical protein